MLVLRLKRFAICQFDNTESPEDGSKFSYRNFTETWSVERNVCGGNEILVLRIVS